MADAFLEAAEEARRLFRSCDANLSGVIGREELTKVLKVVNNDFDWDGIVKEVDYNHDGRISYHDFLTYLLADFTPRPGTCPAKLSSELLETEPRDGQASLTDDPDEVNAQVQTPAVVVKPEAKADELEFLRARARKSLEVAAESGGLDAFLSEMAPAEAAAEVVLKSSADQVLRTPSADQVVRTPSAEDDEYIKEIRKLAANTLAVACDDGRLDSVLLDVQRVSEPTKLPIDSSIDFEELRILAARRLTEASMDGSLLNILKASGEPAPPAELDEVKPVAPEKARPAAPEAAPPALDVSSSGFGEASDEQPLPEPSPAAPEEESLAPALDASQAGRDAVAALNAWAEDAIVDKEVAPEIPSAPATDMEALRRKMRQTLQQGSEDGTLEKALACTKDQLAVATPELPTIPPIDDETPTPVLDMEPLRINLRSTLIKATEDGNLQEALEAAAATPEATEAAPELPTIPPVVDEAPALDIETLRINLRSTLIKATEDGALQEALACTKAEVAAATPEAAEAAPELPTILPVVGETPAPDIEKLRTNLRSTLIKATEDGNLQEALACTKAEVAAATPEVTAVVSVPAVPTADLQIEAPVVPAADLQKEPPVQDATAEPVETEETTPSAPAPKEDPVVSPPSLPPPMLATAPPPQVVYVKDPAIDEMRKRMERIEELLLAQSRPSSPQIVIPKFNGNGSFTSQEGMTAVFTDSAVVSEGADCSDVRVIAEGVCNVPSWGERGAMFVYKAHEDAWQEIRHGSKGVAPVLWQRQSF